MSGSVIAQGRTRRAAAVNGVGLREQNRLDKLARIRVAAKELFTEQGFERATTRDIARRAHVGLGTLFNYADDKRDLVFLIFNEELDRITDRGFDAANPRHTLVGQLTAAFSVFYRAFAENPTLSRALLQELTFYSRGRLADDFQRSRRRTIGRIEQLVSQAQRARQLRRSADPALVALGIFFLYSGSVRWWIAADRPDPKVGIAALRRLLELNLAGVLVKARRISIR